MMILLAVERTGSVVLWFCPQMDASETAHGVWGLKMNFWLFYLSEDCLLWHISLISCFEAQVPQDFRQFSGSFPSSLFSNSTSYLPSKYSYDILLSSTNMSNVDYSLHIPRTCSPLEYTRDRKRHIPLWKRALLNNLWFSSFSYAIAFGYLWHSPMWLQYGQQG